jgi:nickel transport system ATP-binding protein
MMLSVENVFKTYHSGNMFSRKRRQILKDISFTVGKGECLGIIGESGGGKSTLSRLILGIERPDSGAVRFYGKNVLDAKVRRGRISVVFQDYTSSFNPNYTVYDALSEPLLMEKRLPQKELRRRSVLLLEQAGLNENCLAKYPHELSGGEAQRVCIARATAARPELLILDEVVSSVDVSAQVQILDLFYRLKNETDTGYVFITHDIEAAAYICDRLLFLRGGQIIEETPVTELNGVKSEYAKELLASVIYV